MKLIFISLYLLLSAGFLYGQENSAPQEKSYPTGYCERATLESGDFGISFEKEHHDYRPDAEVAEKLRAYSGKFRISIILGIWCQDSKEQVPRFFRILDDNGLSGSVDEIINVDREKKAGEISLEKYGIEKVPTFIVYVNGSEAGRITETPQASLEDDLLKILKDAVLSEDN